MCGIAGYIDYEHNIRESQPILQAMGATMRDRGPDARGTWAVEHAGFGHQRLIVIDPEGGAQPMTRRVKERTYTIVYNGELYNTDDLRDSLKSRGYTFESRSDTEVLLLSCVEWGEQCVTRLNGIFAFAVWRHEDEQLFMARDRLGVKPLFYATEGSAFVFGSELKSILAHPAIKPRVNREGLAEVLFVGPARTPGHGILRNVHELRPGHRLALSRSGAKVTPYWRLESRPHEDDFPKTVRRVRELLEDAVVRQLVSDVPIATLLSGGLDSSAVSAIAARSLAVQGRGQLQTFSVDFVDMDRYFQENAFQTGRDAPWVDRVSRHLGTLHHSIVIDTPAMNDHLLRPLSARDLPGMADIDVSLYMFCRDIKRDATVALSGEAADEVFGGYPWFHKEEALSADTFPWSLRLAERMRMYNQDLLRALQPVEYVHDRYREALAEVPRLSGETPGDARIREISYLNITRFLSTLLERKDRMSMAASLEVRVPFCDHRLVEYVWNIPWEMKARNGVPKAVLREAVRGWLPDDVIDRKKSPYPSTPHPAYLEKVRSDLQGVLDNPSSPLLALLDVASVRKAMDDSRGTLEHRPWFGQIMATPQMFDYLVQVNAWLKDLHVDLEI